MRSLADPLPINTAEESMGSHRLAVVGPVREMERTYTDERAAYARNVAEAAGRRVGHTHRLHC